MDLTNGKLSLHLDDLTDVFVFDYFVDFALHHSGARVVLDESLPSYFWHLEVLGEALLSKVLDGVVVGVRDEVLDTNSLCMGLKPIHQSSSISLDLLTSRNRKEHYLSEPLLYEWSEDATSQNVHFDLAFVVGHFSLDDHGLVLSVHGQTDDVVTGHSGKLLGDDILQVD